MILLFKIRIGNLMFENWHLYQLREHSSKSGSAKWVMWDKVI